MLEWNPDTYIKFEQQRTQPAVDLAARLHMRKMRRILDIGCGPGNSTSILNVQFPDASIVGIDSSEDMITKAKARYPSLDFKLQDVHTLDGTYDLLFSNACLQWIPDHAQLLPFLMRHIAPDGALAVQMPDNMDEPLYRIIDEVAAQPKWNFTPAAFPHNSILSPEAYYDILTACSSSIDVWKTIYYHTLPGCRAMVDWVKGSRLRPYLNALEPAQAACFEEEILALAQKAYPLQSDGTVLFRFKRLFFIADK